MKHRIIKKKLTQKEREIRRGLKKSVQKIAQLKKGIFTVSIKADYNDCAESRYTNEKLVIKKQVYYRAMRVIDGFGTANNVSITLRFPRKAYNENR